MAHEYIQAMQALVRLKDSQKYAFQCWADEYRGDLGIALSDTLGVDVFLNDFDLYFAKLFDGARHDSGNPMDWCAKLINHYKNLGIDPKTKTEKTIKTTQLIFFIFTLLKNLSCYFFDLKWSIKGFNGFLLSQE